MRARLLFAVACLAGGCVVEEPAGGLAGVSWSEAEIEPQSEPYVVWRPSCEHHFECCHETKLGDIQDDYGRTRCYFCAERCDQEGQWPRKTFAGKDCEYWKDEYRLRPPRGGCA
jgi:hypothetical protein